MYEESDGSGGFNNDPSKTFSTVSTGLKIEFSIATAHLTNTFRLQIQTSGCPLFWPGDVATISLE